MVRTAWLAAALLALVLAACGGSGGNSLLDRGTASPSCSAISQIKSYRYQVRLKLQTPTFEPSVETSPAPPLSAFAQAIVNVFADMQLDGAYVAPDRSQVIMTVGDQKLELRSVGSRTWVNANDVWQEQETPADLGLLTPAVICEDIVAELAPSLKDVAPQEEEISGIRTDHYRLEKADIKGLPDLLGGVAGQLPQRFGVDVWLTRDGSWPARLRIAAADVDERGRPMAIDLFMEFRDVNDPGISVEPPA